MLGRGCKGRWVWRGQGEASGGESDLVERILASRGIAPGERGAFLEPSLRQLHEPSLMADMDRAAARMLEAVARRERITIYGDYDVDGVTATAILYHTLRTIDPMARVASYVPHRLEEGYGLNCAAIEAIAKGDGGGDGGGGGAGLIVSVDCGVTAVEPAKAAKAAGVDLIITDHHNPPAEGEAWPEAYAIVHPRRAGIRGGGGGEGVKTLAGASGSYPFGELSGAGVAYKLAWRLATMSCGTERVSEGLRALLLEMLAFAALGTVADAVPLVGENRVIARHGLGRVKHSKIEGLRALVEASGLAGENVDAEDAGFLLAPRLNACGRLGHAREAVELFTTATGDRAREIAAQLSALNDQRRAMERRMADQACELAEAAGMHRDDKRAIVLASPDWHAGVIGIVCSRLVERYHRPTILMQEMDGECHGSGRSIDGFSLHAALACCAGHLSSWGGHDMAAGLRLSAAKLGAFQEAFIAAANERLTPTDLTLALAIDARASVEELTERAVRRLELLEPFGRGNPRPRVLLEGLRIDEAPKLMGAGGKHLSLRVRGQGDGGAGGKPGRSLRLVAWNWGDKVEQFARGMTIRAVVGPKLNTWNGVTSVEGEIEDLDVREPEVVRVVEASVAEKV